MVATSLRLIRKPLRCEGNRTVDDVSGGSRSRRVVRNVNRRWVYGGAVGALIVITACGKTSTSTVTGPTPAKCDISVAASGDSVAAVNKAGVEGPELLTPPQAEQPAQLSLDA